MVFTGAFGVISGLHLNLKKCVTIPLGAGTLQDFTTTRNTRMPAWAHMPVTDYGKYLGFMVGPGKGDKSWEEPSRKYLQRCRSWAGQGVGMHYHTVAYNTFAVSMLSYVGQLEQVPSATLVQESRGLQLTHKGPKKLDQ